VIDRAGVEAYCCECYRVVRRAHDRLPGPCIDPQQNGNGDRSAALIAI
jgi:hypothetical protein